MRLLMDIWRTLFTTKTQPPKLHFTQKLNQIIRRISMYQVYAAAVYAIPSLVRIVTW